MITIVRRLSPSWAKTIQSTSSHPTSLWCSWILSFYLHLVLTSGLFTSHASEALVCILCCPLRATCPAHLILFFYNPSYIWSGKQITQLNMQFFSSQLLLTSLLHLRPNNYILFSTLFSNTPNLPSVWQTKPHAHTKQQIKLQFSIFSLSRFSVANATTKYVF